MAAFGIPQEAVERPERPIEVWECCKESVQVFCAMETQWNFGAMGGVLGMRYEALPAVWQGLSVEPSQIPQIFADLRVMERAAKEEMRAQNGSR